MTEQNTSYTAHALFVTSTYFTYDTRDGSTARAVKHMFQDRYGSIEFFTCWPRQIHLLGSKTKKGRTYLLTNIRLKMVPGKDSNKTFRDLVFGSLSQAIDVTDIAPIQLVETKEITTISEMNQMVANTRVTFQGIVLRKGAKTLVGSPLKPLEKSIIYIGDLQFQVVSLHVWKSNKQFASVLQEGHAYTFSNMIVHVFKGIRSLEISSVYPNTEIVDLRPDEAAQFLPVYE